MLYNLEIKYIYPVPTIAITEGFLPTLVVAAEGFRHSYNDAFFIDRKRSTCDVVTSSTNPLDFVLQADAKQFHSTLINLTLVLRDGDCCDDNQVTAIRVC